MLERARRSASAMPFEFEPALSAARPSMRTGEALPAATLALCRRADAVLLGAVGGPKWSRPDAKVRPEQGLLQLRKALGLFANLRPVRAAPGAARRLAHQGASCCAASTSWSCASSPAGSISATSSAPPPRRTTCAATAWPRSSAWCALAAQLARARRRKLTSVDKANVLETSRLWRAVVERVLPAEFPDVSFEHMLVDAAAMHLLRRPRDFDVIVTENMFGDILTDEASMLAGSLGLLPSASLGLGRAADCTSRSTAPPRTSPAAASPIPMRRS